MKYALIGLLIGSAQASDVPVFSETLKQAETSVLQNSGIVKAAEKSYVASEHQADSSESALYPKVTFDGTYFYQTNVPQITLPVGSPIGFGDYNNYNVGPTLTYTLFDDGHSRRLWKSSQFLAQAKHEDSDSTKRQMLLNTRLAYIKVQLGLGNLTLTANSLKLSRAREMDVSNRFRAGAASRLDAVNAKREVLTYRLKLREAQNDLSASIRDLLAITNQKQDIDCSRPYPKELRNEIPDELDHPTIFVSFDSLEQSIKNLRVPSPSKTDADHPQIRSLSHSAEASRLAADAQTSQLWPKIQLSARSEYLYPNGPILQTAQQNIFAVNLSMPLFEGGLSRSQAEQHASEAESLEFQRQQKIIDLDRDRKKAGELLENLHAQEKLSQENAGQAEAAAKLTYQSYKAGKQQYLDVETANLRLLEAQIIAAQIQANILSTVAQLNFLLSKAEE